MALYPKMVFLTRVGIDPEKVLVEKGIAPLGRIKETYAENPLTCNHQQGDSNDGCGKQLDPASSVQGPGKQGHLHPGHPRCTHPVDGHNEIQPGKDG